MKLHVVDELILQTCGFVWKCNIHQYPSPNKLQSICPLNPPIFWTLQDGLFYWFYCSTTNSRLKSSAVSTSAICDSTTARFPSAIQTPQPPTKRSWIRGRPPWWHLWRIGSLSQPPWHRSASLQWPCPQDQTPRWAPMWCSSANHVPNQWILQPCQQEGYHGKSSQRRVWGWRKTALIAYLRWWTSMTTSYFELFWWFLTGNQQFSDESEKHCHPFLWRAFWGTVW